MGVYGEGKNFLDIILRENFKSRYVISGVSLYYKALDSGSLGSQIDEERSQLCEPRRIAGLHETSTLVYPSIHSKISKYIQVYFQNPG